MIVEDSSNYGTGQSNNREAFDNGDGNQNAMETASSARSTLQGLVQGVGEYESHQRNPLGYSKTPGGDVDLDLAPYLLLDLRDRDEFDECHIISAQNYPIAMLSRSVNFETADMLAYRNKPGRIIVLYDEDERLAPRAATTLVQRGYNNIFLLSGGLKLAWKNFPAGLIIGEMPEAVREALRTRMRERSVGSLTSRLSSAGSSATNQSNSRLSPKNPAVSGNRLGKPALYCPVGSRNSQEGGEDFLAEDIMKLTLFVERGFEDSSSTRSGYARSTLSSVRHLACTNGTNKKAFR